jgi:sarcosine oxidase
MPPSPDVIVVGLGAMGSATLRAISRRGLRVLGIDRFAPPHDRGSSHGDSRIIREAYFEHPSYVPLVQRAYVLWDEIARESGRTLFTRTGGVMIGPPGGVLVPGSLRSAREHGLAHEVLDAAAIQARVPAFRPRADWIGVWEPNAGVLRPEAAIEAMLAGAAAHGAAVRTGEVVTGWSADGAGVEVRTDRGVHRAGQLVLAAGAWMPRLVPELPLETVRRVLFWFETVAARVAHDVCPISIWEHDPGRYIYSFPRTERGVKVAHHDLGGAADPDRLDREVRPEEVAAIRALLHDMMPFASGPLLSTAVCMYTKTPDEDFVVDRHPVHDRVVVASPCSGHGFKFAPAIGEAISDLVVEGWTRHDLRRFAANRWDSFPAAPPATAPSPA